MLTKNKNNKGFTLVEILVTMTILLVIVYIGMDYLVLSFKLARHSNEQDQAVSIARKSMSTIIKEIRGANTSEQGDYPLNNIEDDNFIFYSDIDDDDMFERVQYVLASSTLYRVITEAGPSGDYTQSAATSTLAMYMNNEEDPVFVFFDEQYNETNTINDIRLIKIILKINVTPTISPNDVFVESDVNLRNLKDNL